MKWTNVKIKKEKKKSFDRAYRVLVLCCLAVLLELKRSSAEEDARFMWAQREVCPLSPVSPSLSVCLSLPYYPSLSLYLSSFSSGETTLKASLRLLKNLIQALF